MDLSPDGRLIAVTKQEAGARERGHLGGRLAKAVSHRGDDGPADDINPVWSPDGQRIAFTSWRKGNADIYIKNANNVGDETPLIADAGSMNPSRTGPRTASTSPSGAAG